MAHKIAGAIIENGQIKSGSRQLPKGRLKVHLIYDVGDRELSDSEVSKIISATSGIYKDIDAEAESRELRDSWERSVPGL